MKRLAVRLLAFALMLGALPFARGRDLEASNAPDLGKMTSSNLTDLASIQRSNNLVNCQEELDRGHKERLEKDFTTAAKTLIGVLQGEAPDEFRRRALFELALDTQDEGELVKAQQIFGQYFQLFSEDPSAPEVLLRQGLLYRQMGVNTLALSKFYAVMSTALKLKLDNVEYYRRLVLQAQTEIADTYYLDGKFDSASEFFARILKADSSDLNKEQIEYKLVRSLGYLPNASETALRAQDFIEQYTNSTDLAEVRFLYAAALKEMGHNQDSMRQVLLLLQSQQDNVDKNPEVWAYWQRRAGNEIANQFYKEGDYLDALEIYLNLAPLDHSLGWQAPVLYQSGLVYEQLQQWQKATDTYTSIVVRTNELTDAVSTPVLRSLFEMAQWRKDYIGWMERARASNSIYQLSVMTTNMLPGGTK